MIELDMHTLWIWMVLAEGLFALLLGVAWSVRRAEPALAYWALASLSLSLGCLGISLRGQLPDWLSIGLANLLFGLGWTLRWAGLRRFAQQPLRLVWVLGPPLVIGLAFQLRDWLHLETSTRVALVALVSGVYVVLMILDALRAQQQERLVMRSVIIGISVPGVVFATFAQMLIMKVNFITALNWPIAGSGSLRHLIVPSFILGMGTMAFITRLMRSSML